MKPTKMMMIQLLLKQRCRLHENWPLNGCKRIYYTTKAIICILVDRRRSLWADSNAIDGAAVFDARHFSGPDGEVIEWFEIAVSRGALDWHYDLYVNGT